MKTQIEIDIPDGWEFVRFGVPREGESFITVTGKVSPYYFGCGLYRIVIRQVWQWPVWLKAEWIAMDKGGDCWWAFNAEPQVNEDCFGGWFSPKDGRILYEKNHFDWCTDFTPPPCTDWRKSKRRRPT